MSILDQLFTEEEAEALAQKVLDATKKKIDDQITQEFYESTKNYLSDIYLNAESSIKRKMLIDLAAKYAKNPSRPEYSDIRDKLWMEHKDEIIPSITDKFIKDNMEAALKHYTSSDYYFNWQWEDGIVTLVLSNWDSFKDDERIANGFGREIERLKSRIRSLENEINDSHCLAD
jgi:hypothetical protein